MSMIKRPTWPSWLACACLLHTAFISAPALAEQDVLRVSAIPGRSPTETLRKSNAACLTWNRTGYEIKLSTAFSDYAGHVVRPWRAALGFCLAGRFYLLQAAQFVPVIAIPLVSASGCGITSTFITSDPDINEHKDSEAARASLRVRCLDDPANLIARYLCKQDGLDVDKLTWGRVVISGAP